MRDPSYQELLRAVEEKLTDIETHDTLDTLARDMAEKSSTKIISHWREVLQETIDGRWAADGANFWRNRGWEVLGLENRIVNFVNKEKRRLGVD